MGLRVAALAAAVFVAGSPAANGVRYVQSHELATGAYAEVSGHADAELTAWAVLGIRAAGTPPSAETQRYLRTQVGAAAGATDAALLALAQPDARAVADVERRERANGSFDGLVNATAWSVLALRASGRPVDPKTVRWLLAKQSRSGGWGWTVGAVDSNDTAAVVEALRAAGTRGRPIERALRFLGRYRNRDGGFELTLGRGSDAQSTAWAVQAFLAAGRPAPRGALAYLRRLQRPDGSFRYSLRYVTTPVWVTSQVLPALAGKPFPLRD